MAQISVEELDMKVLTKGRILKYKKWLYYVYNKRTFNKYTKGSLFPEN